MREAREAREDTHRRTIMHCELRTWIAVEYSPVVAAEAGLRRPSFKVDADAAEFVVTVLTREDEGVELRLRTEGDKLAGCAADVGAEGCCDLVGGRHFQWHLVVAVQRVDVHSVANGGELERVCDVAVYRGRVFGDGWADIFAPVNLRR